MSAEPSPSASPVDWAAPDRLDYLERLCADVASPWALVSSSRTITGTIVLHDRNGMAIADLYTKGAPCPGDKLIGIAPVVIGQLVAEVRRLRAADREARFAAGERICVGCGKTPIATFGGLCIDCDAVEEETHG